MPKTVVRKYVVYEYNELNEKARERVKNWYLDGLEPEIFTEDCLMRLGELFPASELKIEYSLNGCQGDGFNIYGKIHLTEVLEKIKEQFPKRELKFFKWIFDTYGDTYEMSANYRYTYCICSRNDFLENFLEWMRAEGMRDIPEDVVKKFNEAAGAYLDNLCREFEKNGYEYFYEISNEDLQDVCNSNEWLFMKDGTFFVA